RFFSSTKQRSPVEPLWGRFGLAARGARAVTTGKLPESGRTPPRISSDPTPEGIKGHPARIAHARHNWRYESGGQVRLSDERFDRTRRAGRREYTNCRTSARCKIGCGNCEDRV